MCVCDINEYYLDNIIVWWVLGVVDSYIVGGDWNSWRLRRVGWIILLCVYLIDSNINSICFYIYICSLKYLILFIL